MPRDLNDIIPPSRRKVMMDMNAPAATANTYVAPSPGIPSEETYTTQPPQNQDIGTVPSKRSFPVGTALVALAIIAGCGLVFYSFSGAKVVVSPVTSPATVTADFVAYADKGDLTFQTVTVEKTATADIQASGVSDVQEAAHGTIVIHNGQSTKQALIKNTRFQTADGLIFRIHDSVSVPSGGDLTVEVYADEPGDKFNVGPTSFTIPGLKGSTAFTQVTATAAAAMTGGFIGKRATAPKELKDKTYASMQAELTTQLQKDLASKVPLGYVLIGGASYPAYTPGPDQAKSTDTVTLSEKGTITAVVFPESALARAIAFKSIGTYDGSAVSFESVNALTIRPTEATLAPDAATYSFTISGTTNIVWNIDVDKIAGAVAGKTRESAEIALKSFLEVDGATLILRPFWAQSFPADPKKIQVVVSPKTTAQ